MSLNGRPTLLEVSHFKETLVNALAKHIDAAQQGISRKAGWLCGVWRLTRRCNTGRLTLSEPAEFAVLCYVQNGAPKEVLTPDPRFVSLGTP